VGIKAQVRCFADHKEIDKQIHETKRRIDDVDERRADAREKDEPSTLRDPALNPETDIHATSSSSSSVRPSETPMQHSSPPPKDDTVNPSNLPSALSATRSHLTTRLAHLIDTLQSRVFTASRHLNDLTGYTGIEALKNSIEQQEFLVTKRKAAVQSARTAYAATVAARSTTQREVNDLLHRKNTWSPSDLERFTNLYRSDHASEAEEGIAAAKLAESEGLYEEASSQLGKSILARYHEEQIWSDKIRQMSTWGTWGLMGLNVLLFIVFQVAVEPWRRRRLVKGFEEKVQEALKLQQLRHEGELGKQSVVKKGGVGSEEIEQERGGTLSESLVAHVVDSVTGTSETDAQVMAEETAIEQAVTAELQTEHAQDTSAGNASTNTPTNALPTPTASGYAYYEEAFRELFSEKRMTLTQKELTTVAIEGACGGAAVMGLLLVLLRPR
jgi:sensitive to high expression protein 9